MATRTELLEIISNGENSGVEFKRDVLETHALAKELAWCYWVWKMTGTYQA
jgi:ATP-dependent DNA helicase RecG